MNGHKLLSVKVVEAHARRCEAQVNSAGWTIALFGDDEFGDVLSIFGHRLAFLG